MSSKKSAARGRLGRCLPCAAAGAGGDVGGCAGGGSGGGGPDGSGAVKGAGRVSIWRYRSLKRSVEHVPEKLVFCSQLLAGGAAEGANGAAGGLRP